MLASSSIATLLRTVTTRNNLRAMSTRALSSFPVAVKVSQNEIKNSNLSWKNLEIAVRSLHRDGLVVLEDVIEHTKLDRLNTKMVKDAQYLQSLGDAGPFNYNKG